MTINTYLQLRGPLTSYTSVTELYDIVNQLTSKIQTKWKNNGTSFANRKHEKRRPYKTGEINQRIHRFQTSVRSFHNSKTITIKNKFKICDQWLRNFKVCKQDVYAFGLWSVTRNLNTINFIDCWIFFTNLYTAAFVVKYFLIFFTRSYWIIMYWLPSRNSSNFN